MDEILLAAKGLKLREPARQALARLAGAIRRGDADAVLARETARQVRREGTRRESDPA